MNESVLVEFSVEAMAVYDYVSKRALSSKSERIMLNAILRNIELIKNNYSHGEPIAKRLIPKNYLIKYETTNLYRLELPFFWRMLYTVKGNKVEIIALVIDIISHKDYNKKFRYK